jgi:hypothetical protein
VGKRSDSGKANPKESWSTPSIVVGIVGVIATAVVSIGIAIYQHESGSATEPPVNIDSIHLAAPVTSFNLRCPTTLVYDGRIDVDSGRGTASYQFSYHDGIDGSEKYEPIKEIKVAAGSTDVRYEWRPSIPIGEVSRTVTLHTIDPVRRSTSPVTITGRCDAGLPEGPSSPPPDPGGTPG